MANELTSQQVDTLLDKLANDDAFRDAVCADPAAALQSIGLPVTLAACFQKAASLPSKQAAVSAGRLLRNSANVTLSQEIHNLVAR